MSLDFETQILADKEQTLPAIPQNAFNIIRDEHFLFLSRLFDIFDKNLDDPNFKSSNLYTLLGLSKSQTYRKLKSLTGMAPNHFIQELRLRQSLKDIKKGNQTIAEIAYNLGFNSPTYFTRIFRKRFSISPTSFAKNK